MLEGLDKKSKVGHNKVEIILDWLHRCHNERFQVST